jgi:hypothetical protein
MPSYVDNFETHCLVFRDEGLEDCGDSVLPRLSPLTKLFQGLWGTTIIQ